MTMLSFRVDDNEAADAAQRAAQFGVGLSDLLREALHSHLVRLAAEADVLAWRAQPLTDAELSLGDVADWGPAEEWSDWGDATR
ncbi:MAG: antitoxin [Chloroflexi bacterium]|nr:MAG: antitoxin [Chloroflexota bacterium]